MKPNFFELTMQVFNDGERFNWSVIQDWDEEKPEPLAYGMADTFEEAIHSAGDEIKAMFG